MVLAAGGFSSLVYGLSRLGVGSWIQPAAFIGVGVAMVVAFAVYQVVLQRTDSPLLDLRTLTHRTYALSLVLMSAGFMAFLGSMILLPLYLQTLRGLSELEAGLLVMPGGIVMGLLGPQVGKLYDRFGSRPLVIPGSIGMVVALGLLTRLALDTPFGVVLAIHMVLMICLAMVFTPVFTLGLGDLPPHLYSHGSSLLGTLQQVAGAIGTAALIVVMDNRADSLLAGGADPVDAAMGGLQWAFAGGALIAVVVVVTAVLLPSKVEAPEGVPAAH
ncbi:MFS transporter [Nocardioides sambongensis]|uniref:MFS transporter n=1 Tax=Nocardioides sambongensis TaxID=2589074 RepID=UPI001E5035A1|nr:MFS transporter [Nocardioides sambongensis]